MGGVPGPGGGVKLPTKTVDFRRVVSDIGGGGSGWCAEVAGDVCVLEAFGKYRLGGVFFFFYR